MKAVYSEKNGGKRIELEDKTVFEALPTETKETFTKRVSSVVDNLELTEALPAEPTEAPAKKVVAKKTSTKKVGVVGKDKKVVVDKKTEVQADIVKKVASVKGKVAVDAPVNVGKSPHVTLEPAAETGTAPVGKAVERAEANRKAAKAAKPKLVNRNPTLRDALNSKQEGDAYVDKVVDMYPFRSNTLVTGVVKQVVIDKRVNRAYLRVYDQNGKLYHTDVANKRFTINEAETKKREAAQQKQFEERMAYLREKENARIRKRAEQAQARYRAKEQRRAENRRKYREMAEAHKKISIAARKVKVAENALVRLRVALTKAKGRAEEWAKETELLTKRIGLAEQDLVVLRQKADEVVQAIEY